MTNVADIPRCYACGGVERPFKLVPAGKQWRHVAERPISGGTVPCDAIVCPVCGAAPEAGATFCAECKAVGEQLRQQQGQQGQQRTGRGRQRRKAK